MSTDSKMGAWDEGIVLGGVTVGESDRILHLLTRSHGLLSGIAKGAKRSARRFAGALEPFTSIAIRFRDRRASPLAFYFEADVVVSRLGLRRDIWRMAVATAAVELTRAVSRDREANAPLFSALEALLDSCTVREPRREILFSFECAALTAAGLFPALDRCVSCGSEDVVAFDAPHAGVICTACEPPSAIPMAPDARLALATLRDRGLPSIPSDLSQAPKLSMRLFRTIADILGSFLEYQLGRQLRARSFALDELERACDENRGLF